MTGLYLAESLVICSKFVMLMFFSDTLKHNTDEKSKHHSYAMVVCWVQYSVMTLSQ